MEVCSRILPTMIGTFVRWIDQTTFLALVDGVEIMCHRDYWIFIKEEKP